VKDSTRRIDLEVGYFGLVMGIGEEGEEREEAKGVDDFDLDGFLFLNIFIYLYS
jgi:hypothetical protein